MSVATIEKRGRKSRADSGRENDQSAEQTYRNAVFEAAKKGNTPEVDPEILDGANRLPSDFADDVKTYRRRLAAAETQKNLPGLEAEALRLQQEATGENIGVKPLTDFGTIDALWDALEQYRAAKSPGFVSPAKIKAHKAATAVQSARAESMRVFGETADPSIASEVDGLRCRIEGLRRIIAERLTPSRLEKRIADVESEIEQLAKGKRPSHLLTDPRQTDALYREARRQRRELIGKRAEAAEAQRKNDADEQRIAELQDRIRATEAKKFVAENMRWSTA
ncbi:MAG: hypothetical protein LLF97_07025 [Planctomycetaceae bacterium]|nr:hypothetical protein [Planctomycetaceae bacterium]